MYDLLTLWLECEFIFVTWLIWVLVLSMLIDSRSFGKLFVAITTLGYNLPSYLRESVSKYEIVTCDYKDRVLRQNALQEDFCDIFVALLSHIRMAMNDDVSKGILKCILLTLMTLYTWFRLSFIFRKQSLRLIEEKITCMICLSTITSPKRTFLK